MAKQKSKDWRYKLLGLFFIVISIVLIIVYLISFSRYGYFISGSQYFLFGIIAPAALLEFTYPSPSFPSPLVSLWLLFFLWFGVCLWKNAPNQKNITITSPISILLVGTGIFLFNVISVLIGETYNTQLFMDPLILLVLTWILWVWGFIALLRQEWSSFLKLKLGLKK